MRHKLTTFILKNPPKKKSKGRRASNEAKKGEGDAEQTASPAGEDADELTLRLQSEAADLAPVEKTAMAKEEWSGATDPDAIASRVKSLSLDVEGSDEDKGDDPMEQLRLWIEVNHGALTPKAVMAKIEQLGIKERHRTVQIVAECVFTSKILSGKELDKYNPLIKEVRPLVF